MAINKESNGYIILFSVIMVVVVGTVLATVAMALQPFQQENVKNEKKQNILQSIGLREMTRKEAGAGFEKYVVKRLILDYDGKIKKGTIYEGAREIKAKDENDAFNVDMLDQYKNIKDPADRDYPLFICEMKGEIYYVAPLMGQGLWSSVWGYISLNAEGTVQGAVFDHKSETPGLGAEISKYEIFQSQFEGKKIIRNGEYAPISVKKPGGDLNDHEVDGISGGTFTGQGVDEMLNRTLEVYYKFLKNNPNYK